MQIRDRLSKSAFLRGLQCEKSLYLYRYHPELREERDAQSTLILDRGTNIGLLARGLFPGGVAADVPPEGVDQVSYTKQLIDAGHSVIYEAAFSHSGVYCAVDILVRDGREWEVFEVKSSLSVKEVNYVDAALQYYVLTGAGLLLEDFCIVHLNRDYALGESIDVDSLFLFTAVLEECVIRTEDVRRDVERLRGVLRRNDVPAVDIGAHCATPYGCDFAGHCWKHIPDVSIFTLPKIRSKRIFELYQTGVVRIDDIPGDFDLGKAAVVAEAHKTGRPFVDPEGIRAFLEKLVEPVSFMDFETIFPALPVFKGTRPYQQVPFQFCFGTVESGEVRWTDFLADAGSDPRPAFLENLLLAAGKEGSIVVYNKSFEVGRLRELAVLFPEHRDAVMKLIRRIRDLLDVFRGSLFYDPSMMGSNSIKKVLPVFAPEMSYANLDIQDGGGASSAFEALQKMDDPGKAADIRRALIAYCRNDTEGMMRIWEGLKKIGLGKQAKQIETGDVHEY